MLTTTATTTPDYMKKRKDYCWWVYNSGWEGNGRRARGRQRVGEREVVNLWNRQPQKRGNVEYWSLPKQPSNSRPNVQPMREINSIFNSQLEHKTGPFKRFVQHCDSSPARRSAADAVIVAVVLWLCVHYVWAFVYAPISGVRQYLAIHVLA